MRELSEFRKDLLAFRLNGQLSLSKLSWLLNTRALIRKTKDKKNPHKSWQHKLGEKNQKGFLIWCIVRFIIHDWRINKISLDSLNKKVFQTCLKVCPLTDMFRVIWEINFSRAYVQWTIVSCSASTWSYMTLNFSDFELVSCRALVFWTVVWGILLWTVNTFNNYSKWMLCI